MNALSINNNATAANLQQAYAATTTPPATKTGSSTVDGTTITSSDFLVLLVAQLKNQDPTQPTDPTAYVQQLVGVNSLEQLIDLNKQITSLGGTTTPTTTPTPAA